MVNNKRTRWRFGFGGVLGEEATQEETFDRVAQPVVQSVVDGFNGTVFAYGQTGSGKTYTLTGGADSYASRGIIPRAISAIFAAVGTAADDVEHTVRISYLEIYNDAGFDLLDRASSSASARPAARAASPSCRACRASSRRRMARRCACAASRRT